MESVNATTQTPSWPKIVPGCPTCEGFAIEREAAYFRRDYSLASDHNVLLVRHQWKDHRPEGQKS